MAVLGIPVVVAENGLGTPVNPVSENAPLMTIAENGIGTPIVISPLGAPFIVQGYEEVESQFALSSDDGSNLVDDDESVMETYNGFATT